MTANDRNGNRLKKESSPYLLQHADNPVDWFPWCEEAFETARREDKPIILSIGYSSCHWCHVMAHESFENPDVAELMNEEFINIKVDREERPDVDRIYQTAHQILTQRPGGWPLTVFLNPDDLVPFFAGTYFPAEPRHGLPGFHDLLQQTADFYHRNREDLIRQNRSMERVFRDLKPEGLPEGATINLDPFFRARHILETEFDPRYGGIGTAPKFPHAPALELLMLHAQYAKLAGDADRPAERMTLYSLKRMMEGGLFDQVGGGFCRYSVDAMWEIPHFEKMLYDNGPLLALLADAWRISGDMEFARTAHMTARWALREMQSDAGGFYSAIDADSEGTEGKFYVWDKNEIQQHLDAKEFELFAARYGLVRPANFEGKWHLHVYESLESLAKARDTDVKNITKILDRALEKIYAVREKRVPPGKDDKILASWNGLMIRGLAMAGRLLQEPEYVEAAKRAMRFIHENMFKDGRLYATYSGNEARHPAYLDDYVQIAGAALELIEAEWDGALLSFAEELIEIVLDQFEDSEIGGFFFTAKDHESLIHRPKTFADESMPSGNGIAVRVLTRLGHLLGNTGYLQAAERALRAAFPSMLKFPHGHPTLCVALLEYLDPSENIVIRGDKKLMKRWQDFLDGRLYLGRMVFCIPTDADDVPSILADKSPRGDIVAYICKGTTCSPPVQDRNELIERLNDSHRQANLSA